MAGGASASTVLVLLGFCVSVIFIVFVCTRLACALVRLRRRRQRQRWSPPLPHYAVSPYAVFPLHLARHPGAATVGGGGGGLDPAAVSAFPTRAFACAPGASDADSQCVVCLAEYEDKDMLRFFPYCGHNFHMDCIDLWLEQNSTCPVCRVSLRDNLDKTHIAPPPPSLVISTGDTPELPGHEPDLENQIASGPSADGAANNLPVSEDNSLPENHSQTVTKQVDVPS